MNAKQPSTKDPIPEFATREEAAAFWDTHDFDDYWDELEPANLKTGPNLASSILVPMDAGSFGFQGLSRPRMRRDCPVVQPMRRKAAAMLLSPA